MQTDSAYAVIALGVLAGGGLVAKAGLDEFLDPHRAAKHAAEKQEKQTRTRIPMNNIDRVVQFAVTSIMIGGLAMKAYDWLVTGKAPKVEEIL